MIKNFFKRIVIIIFLFSAFNVNCADAVTRYEFLSKLLEARGINWSESEEFLNNNPAAFILRTGYVTDSITDLSPHVTRREVLRWCIESLGLSFEAQLLSDYPVNFKDINKLTPFEHGCLVVASNMSPAIFTKSEKFRGNENLSAKELKAVLERVRNASSNLTLDIVRNPLQGMKVFIHREGVPTGVPAWRVYLDGIKTKTAAQTFQKSLKSEGINVSLTNSEGLYGVRTEKIENYNQVRRLEVIAKARGLKIRILPSMTNTNTRIVPKFWVMLKIDPSYWKILPIISKNNSNELLRLSEISSQNKTKAAINAGFFAVRNFNRGSPIGALKINGKLINSPYDGRACLGWNDSGDEASFGVVSGDFSNWYDMDNIIQAGPMLLDEGRTANTFENFSASLINPRHPRSAVGIDIEGQWFFFVIDGRNGLHSSGATVSELTEILRSQGAYYALNLDGGGSTEIIINGKIYNFVSDGRERRISYGIGVQAVD